MATKKLNVLISGAGSVLGYGATRLVSKYDGVDKVYVANTTKQCPAANYSYRSIVTPDFYFSKRATEKEYIEYVRSFSIENDIDLIIPCSIFELKSYARNIESFEQLGIKVFVEKIEYIETFFDKYETSELLNKMGNYAPKTNLVIANEIPVGVDFPCIVKPRYGYGSNGIDILNDSNSYREWFDNRMEPKYAPYVCQDYLENKNEEYSCAVLYDQNSNPFYASVIRRLKLNKVTTEAIFDEKCEELEKNMLLIGATLDGRYCLNFQFRLKNGRPCIFEVNPRFGASESIRSAFGMDSYFMLMDKYYDVKKASIKRYGKVIRAYQEEYFPL